MAASAGGLRLRGSATQVPARRHGRDLPLDSSECADAFQRARRVLLLDWGGTLSPPAGFYDQATQQATRCRGMSTRSRRCSDPNTHVMIMSA